MIEYPTANELLGRVGQSPRPGGDEIRIPVTLPAWEDDEFMKSYVASRVHLFIDLQSKEESPMEAPDQTVTEGDKVEGDKIEGDKVEQPAEDKPAEDNSDDSNESDE